MTKHEKDIPQEQPYAFFIFSGYIIMLIIGIVIGFVLDFLKGL